MVNGTIIGETQSVTLRDSRDMNIGWRLSQHDYVAVGLLVSPPRRRLPVSTPLRHDNGHTI